MQTAIQNLDTAYQNFFKRVKQGENPGFPKFKNKRDNRKSYKSNMARNNIEIFEKSIKLPKLGLVKCRVSKRVEGRIISATVSQNPSGKYFVSVACTDIDIESFDKTGTAVGIDVGIKNFAIIAFGESQNYNSDKFDNPKYLAKSEKKLIREQHRLSRKPKGSQNRKKARIKVAKIHEKVSNQRNDFLHKITIYLVKNYDIISVENLKIKNMVKNRKLAK